MTLQTILYLGHHQWPAAHMQQTGAKLRGQGHNAQARGHRRRGHLALGGVNDRCLVCA